MHNDNLRFGNQIAHLHYSYSTIQSGALDFLRHWGPLEASEHIQKQI